MYINCPFCTQENGHERHEKVMAGDEYFFHCIKCGVTYNLLLPIDSFVKLLIKTLQAKEKIKAIKFYRQHFGCGLKEAKDAMDTLDQAMVACNFITPF
jgi:transposase-like protein